MARWGLSRQKQTLLILKLEAAPSCEAFARIEKSKHYNIRYLKPSGLTTVRIRNFNSKNSFFYTKCMDVWTVIVTMKSKCLL